MTSEQKFITNRHFIYDGSIIPDISSNLFTAEFHRQNASLLSEGVGRAPVQYIRLGQTECVLRHYHRGGLVGKLIKDHYIWTGLEKTRAWREWQLLHSMVQMQLPVPKPVAAQVVHGGLWYTADLITERVPDAVSLTQGLQQESVPEALWRNIGETIQRFHAAGVYHADLNAHNVLLSGLSSVYLIDFDKGEIRDPLPHWQLNNVSRFKRSLLKLKNTLPVFHFNESDWDYFISAYSSK